MSPKTELKANNPMEFDGDLKKSETFLQECDLYFTMTAPLPPINRRLDSSLHICAVEWLVTGGSYTCG